MYIAFKRSLLTFAILSVGILLLAGGDLLLDRWAFDSLLVRSLWHGAILAATLLFLPKRNEPYRPFAARKMQRLPLALLIIALLHMLISLTANG